MPTRLALSFVFPFALVLLSSSDGRNTKPPDDEAKKNGLTVQTFRYPISDATNFLKGMDAIAMPKDGDAGKARTLPVDQLRDLAQVADEAQLADPVSTQNEILGRNTWMLWCGGNEGFWDWLAGHSYGFTDFLKMIDSRNRPARFDTAGLINEPGMKQAARPDQYGLWLDVPAQPASRGVPEAIYGRSTGVVGLRLFPNPAFEPVRAKWDAKRYYNDPSYYNDPALVRPYRVGMSCAFCHASFHPLNPPASTSEPNWENISGNIGAQYLRIRAVVGNLLKKDNLVYHILDSQPPGTVDTSLVASDSLNNANAMNAIFGLKERVVRSFINPPETQYGHSLTQPALWGNPREMLPAGSSEGFVWQSKTTDLKDIKTRDKVPEAYWHAFQQAGLLERVNGSNDAAQRYIPRVLFDGADSIGAWGALARVYLNIGTYYEQWVLLHNPLIGGAPQSPFTIQDCEDHSVYWQATQERVAPLRDYFLKISPKMPLLAAKGSGERTAKIQPAIIEAAAHGPDSERAEAGRRLAREKATHIDVAQLARGRQVFARNCIVCHSSIQPPEREADLAKWAAKGEFWDHDPGHWLQDDKYIKWAEAEVEKPEFWQNNYLSTDYRVPISVVRTNSARAVATNGLGAHMWNDFTSQSYKRMPASGSVSYFNPYSGKDESYTPRHKSPAGSPDGGGGIGFYRVPSLISIWATAPLLHNNTLGLFNNDPSVNGRLIAFDDAMRKMLWPELRLMISPEDKKPFNEATTERLRKDHGLIWRTTDKTYLHLPGPQLPALLAKVPFLGKLRQLMPWVLKFARAPWLPGAVLLLAAYLILRYAGKKRDHENAADLMRRRFIARLAGLTALTLALAVTALFYLLNGRLGDLNIGPIPKGTPVSLLASFNPEADPALLKQTLSTTVNALAEIESKHLTQEDADTVMREKVAPALLQISRCPDFVMDKGHYFPWLKSMSDEDKNALIELLKTF